MMNALLIAVVSIFANWAWIYVAEAYTDGCLGKDITGILSSIATYVPRSAGHDLVLTRRMCRIFCLAHIFFLGLIANQRSRHLDATREQDLELQTQS
jgi:hypothetical protein